MEVLNVMLWTQEVALISENNSLVYFELQDEKYNCISPVAFSHTQLLKDKATELYKVGLLEDAISGSYGKDYFSKFHFNSFGRQATLMERLSFIGSNGVGAMSFEPSSSNEDINVVISLNEFKNESLSVYEGKDSDIALFIAKSNSGAGGAKAKGVVKYNIEKKEIKLSNTQVKEDDYVNAIVKFNTKVGEEAKKFNEELRLEYVYYLLARESGITMSDSYLETDLDNNDYFITKRFDIDENFNQFHMHSLAGLFSHDASSFSMGYELLFRAALLLGIPSDEYIQIFKNMVFNIVYANRDDHSRNFSFLMDEDCNWFYAPAYDITYSGSNMGLNEHQLTIGKKFAKSTDSLQIKKIAKLLNIDNPLEIVKEIIDIKHKRLRELCEQYKISESMVELIFTDTKKIDQKLGGVYND